jgi:hypothetical protein
MPATPDASTTGALAKHRSLKVGSSPRFWDASPSPYHLIRRARSTRYAALDSKAERLSRFVPKPRRCHPQRHCRRSSLPNLL